MCVCVCTALGWVRQGVQGATGGIKSGMENGVQGVHEPLSARAWVMVIGFF